MSIRNASESVSASVTRRLGEDSQYVKKNLCRLRCRPIETPAARRRRERDPCSVRVGSLARDPTFTGKATVGRSISRSTSRASRPPDTIPDLGRLRGRIASNQAVWSNPTRRGPAGVTAGRASYRGRVGGDYLTMQSTVACTTTLPPRVRMVPVTCGGVPWMKSAAIAVAPAAMSPPSLSKSNSTSSPMV